MFNRRKVQIKNVDGVITVVYKKHPRRIEISCKEQGYVSEMLESHLYNCDRPTWWFFYENLEVLEEGLCITFHTRGKGNTIWFLRNFK